MSRNPVQVQEEEEDQDEEDDGYRPNGKAVKRPMQASKHARPFSPNYALHQGSDGPEPFPAPHGEGLRPQQSAPKPPRDLSAAYTPYPARGTPGVYRGSSRRLK